MCSTSDSERQTTPIAIEKTILETDKIRKKEKPVSRRESDKETSSEMTPLSSYRGNLESSQYRKDFLQSDRDSQTFSTTRRKSGENARKDYLESELSERESRVESDREIKIESDRESKADSFLSHCPLGFFARC